MNNISLKTALGEIKGNRYEDTLEFLGIPYARAGRFEYAKPLDKWEGVLDATKPGNACPQTRQFHQHLENPERLFYYKEFREGLTFNYDEDCLNLNIYTPVDKKNCPVLVFIHGGGFNSGSNNEEPFRGFEYAKRGVIAVFINYRVGVLGYFSHEDIKKKYGRDGNFGLDDQLTAIKWVKKHIKDFGGDPDNITLMGQSAGAISIQYLCLNHANEGLFKRVVMMSGGGMFPKFALPKKVEDTREYWLDYMNIAGCKTLDELKALDLQSMFDAIEEIKAKRKDSTYNTMPVVDGYLIERPVDEIINNPLNVGYMIGYTNNDMYAPIMAYIGNKYGRDNNAWIYFLDINSPGDNNGAFHSSDLRYMFGRLSQSWRKYSDRDREVSGQMINYTVNFMNNDNPNGDNLPSWKPVSRSQKKVLCYRPNGTKMGHPSFIKMAWNMVTKGDPKA